MSVLPSCANCGTALNGPFCSNCGQKASDLHRPIWWIAGEFLDAVFSYDSRTFRTLWLLFSEPGEFTRRYLIGKRASLLPPFRLFVIATVVFFLLLQMTGVALVAFRMETRSLAGLSKAEIAELKAKAGSAVRVGDKEMMTFVTMDLFAPADAAHKVKLSPQQKKMVEDAQVRIETDARGEASKEDKDWVQWITATSARVTRGYEQVLADPVKINAPLNVWLPRLMLVLVPIFALLLAAGHWWPRVYLAEHLVFSVHIHTVIFVALSLAVVVVAIAGASGFLWPVWAILTVYVWMAMYHVYGRSWWLTTIKLAVILMIYSIILTMGLGVIFLIALSEV
jgi:hypothetical protein